MFDIVFQAVPYVIGLAVIAVFILYYMAAQGMLMDFRFGRAVFASTMICVVIGILFFFNDRNLSALNKFGMTQVELCLGLLSTIFVSGLIGVLLDLWAWLRGEKNLPPPFRY